MLNPRACSLDDLKEVYGNRLSLSKRRQARELTGKSNLDEIADVFLGYGIKNIIIKTGKDGCFAKTLLRGSLFRP